MTRLLGLCGCLVLLAVAGCIAVPIHMQEKLLAGREVTNEQTRFIARSTTQREDVIQELGEPYAEFADLRILAYTWEMYTGELLWAGAAPRAAGSIPMYKHFSVLIAFDQTDRVVTFEKLESQWPFETVRELALKWAKAQGLALPKAPSMFAAWEISPAQSTLYCYREGGFWDNPGLPNLKPQVRVDGRVVGYLRKGEYIAIALAPGAHRVTVDYLHWRSLAETAWDRRALGQTVTTIDVQALPGQAHYVAVRLPQGTPVLTARSADEALPALKEMMPMP